MPAEVISGVVAQVSRLQATPRVERIVRPETPAQGNQITADGQALPFKQGSEDPIPLKLESVVTNLNEFVQSISRELNFTVDDTSGKTVIKVIDSVTDKVIRQIPSEEVLALSRHLDELRGVIFQAEV
ncbi:MAG TPA: flagellar protein FlaG [Chromatiaceae bacterium]|jgi:flagellar protein FlaG|nr:flagellar protein FlaG [Chromatiaceae bacterium]HIN82695.1 flagellar protein FlaG [Chromatiales bacterium]HIO17960.1 flagellar protein FlaG [Gammaproteobacteria bacterium]HIA08608.1 flagellar protein FlaG [Chromatiaceae bacterium]HIB84742.1 flagellar protein FlaG [Chromatiaceae bacterium]